MIRAELERLAAEEAIRGGCQRVYTPVLAKRALFELSGHWAKFADDMFPPMRVGNEEIILRPANCPHHALIYAAEQRSFRDLPVRLSELGSMFRSELSGVLGGLSRVRQINLDDTHVFCAPWQVQDEIVRGVEAVRRCYRLLGIDVARYRLSRRGSGEGYLGSPRLWATLSASWPPRSPTSGSTSRTLQARPRSTGRRSTSRSPTRRAGRRPCRPYKSISTSRNVSTSASSAPMARASGR